MILNDVSQKNKSHIARKECVCLECVEVWKLSCLVLLYTDKHFMQWLRKNVKSIIRPARKTSLQFQWYKPGVLIKQLQRSVRR